MFSRSLHILWTLDAYLPTRLSLPCANELSYSKFPFIAAFGKEWLEIP